MKKININFNRPEPDSEEIAGRKDFNSVLQGAKTIKIPMYKKPSFIFSIAASVVIISGMVTYFAMFRGKSNTPIASARFVDPPMQNAIIRNVSYSVDAEKGGEISTDDGTKIHIPASAFADKNGNLVSGKVDITYRGFHDAADFFLSGIPMDYDSGGTRYAFSSAGMVDINGYSKGEPVFIKQGKSLSVEAASAYDGADYNLYKLDTIDKKWTCVGKDKVVKTKGGSSYKDSAAKSENSRTALKMKPADPIQVGPESKQTNANSFTQLADVKPVVRPIEPKKAQKEKLNVQLKVDPDEFPELAVYKNTLFEVQDDNAAKAKYNSVTWTDAKLSESQTKGIYLLDLTSGTKKVTLHVIPVLEGKDYDEAQKEYANQFAEYKSILAYEDKRKMEMEKMRKANEKAAMEANAQMRKRDSAAISNADDVETKVYRVFQISNFGIWNCDHPIEYPFGHMITTALYKDKKGKNIVMRRMYMVEKEQNALFWKRESYSFKFDPKKTIMIWGITVENKIYTYSYDDFAKIPEKVSDFTFVMNEPEKKLTTADDVKKFLGI